jgi:zinc and cadmium transporter
VRLLAIALALSLLGGFGGLSVAATLLFVPTRTRTWLVPALVSYAVGALLGVALLELLPQALGTLSPRRAFGTLLAGILTFFVLEKLALWRHCHARECEVHRPSTGPLVLIGDAAHNFMDGAIIGAAVLTSVPLGISTAIAVLAHEIPHEVGDFAILLNAGFTRRRALLFNATAEAAGLAGAAISFVALDATPRVAPYFLAFAVAGFLYVAMSDLIPDLHRAAADAGAIRQVVLVTAGVATVLVF